MLELTLQAIFSGLLAGALYSLVALGLALVFGTVGVINVAHGELILLAAYVAFELQSAGWGLLAALPAAFVLVSVCSVVIYMLVRRIGHNRELNSLILTFGLSIILTNAILMFWSADIQGTSSAWAHHPIVLVGGTLFTTYSQVLAAVLSLCLVVLLYLWLNRTWYGRAVRAVSSNRDAAKLMGVNPYKVELVAFVVAGILAMFAGVAVFSVRTIFPMLGTHLTVTAFIITALAGMGSISGVLIGGLLIGVVESLTVVWLSPSLRDLTSMILFLVVLVILPSGLTSATTLFKRTG